jgi:hypothetical protein
MSCFDARTASEYTVFTMQALKAHVKNGRLVLDEPTDLPEGAEVTLSIMDDEDDLTDEERAELRAELQASVAEMKAGKGIDADVVLAELRAMK